MALKYQADKILIRCPNWVGDVVMATPALRCMRRNYPRARITLLIRPYVRKILEGAPWFDEMIEYQPSGRRGPRGWLEGAAAMRSVVRRLRRERFDLALLLTHSFRAALLAFLSGIPRRVANTRGDQAWMLTDGLPWPRENGRRVPLPKVEGYMRLCRALGCEGGEDRRQELFFDDALRARAEEMIRRQNGDPDKPMFGIAPGASFGPSKFWSVPKFAAVADALIERRAWQAALLCGPGEERLAEQIAGAMRHRPLSFPPSELGLDVLKPMVSRCRLLICTDSGPRHFGVAFGVPTIVIMGPTDPRHTESDYAKTVILRRDVPCGPCHLRECPTDHRCMEEITPEMVMDASERLLAREDS